VSAQHLHDGQPRSSWESGETRLPASPCATCTKLTEALTQIRDLASQTLDAPSDPMNDSVALAAILAISEKAAR
jgi:hypothetical protein